MSTPTSYEIARAQRAGRVFARAGKPVTDCPFDADGDGSQRVLAMRFVRAYVAERRPVENVDYASGEADTSRADVHEDDEMLRAMDVDGDEFQAYWTRGKGLARWAEKLHPWRTLRRLLRKHPAIRDPEGLASHYFHVVFGIWPGERKGDNPVGPG